MKRVFSISRTSRRTAFTLVEVLISIAIALVRCYIPGLTLRKAAQLTGALRRSRESAAP